MIKFTGLLIFVVILIWNFQATLRNNFLFDYGGITHNAAEGIISFRLFGTNIEEDEPKKIMVRKNPYNLVIRYISDIEFIEATISDFKFYRVNDKRIVLKPSEQTSKCRGSNNGNGCSAGFSYGNQFGEMDLEYVNYGAEGVIYVRKLNGDIIIHPFEVTFETDYHEKSTWDFWEGIMGI